MRAPAERPATLLGFAALCAAMSFGLAAISVGSGADGTLETNSAGTWRANGPAPDASGRSAERDRSVTESAADGAEAVPASTSSTTAPPSSTAAPAPTTTVAPPPSEAPPTVPPPPPPPPVAATPLPPPTTTPDGTVAPLSNRVFVFGDSVILGAASALPAALGGWDVVVDAAESRFEHQAPGILAARRGDIGRVAVILIGHNSGAGYDHETWIRRMMDELAGVERVVFLTAVEWGPGPAEFNQDLRRIAPEYPAIVVADWNALSQSDPGFTFDGLHLLPPGRQAMASLIASAVGPAPA